MKSKVKGRTGEAAAAEILRKKGYKILGMNFSCRAGEIDIIAQKENVVVFVEVKTRKNSSFATRRSSDLGYPKTTLDNSPGLMLSKCMTRTE